MDTDNKFIAAEYKLYTIADGAEQLLEETTDGQPFCLITNMGTNLPAFEEKLAALLAGESFDFVIPRSEAFGEYQDEGVQELEKEIFYIDGQFDYKHIREDAVIPMTNENGERFMARVVEVRDNSVVLDFNHPLAGADLHFVGKILETRPATAEEMAQMARMLSGEGGCAGCNSEGGCEGCGPEGCGGCSN